MTISQDGSVATIPDLTFEQAAPCTEGSHYALAAVRVANIDVGSDVLIYGATGAIGSAALQLAKGLGASVTAVCRGEHALGWSRASGPDRVIDYTTEDFTAHAATYDVVFDAVGKTSFARCKPLLRPNGDLPRDGLRAVPMESAACGDHPCRRHPESALPATQRRPADCAVPAGADPSRRVPTSDRPDVSTRTTSPRPTDMSIPGKRSATS